VASQEQAQIRSSTATSRGAGGARHQRDRGCLVAFADDPPRAVPAFEPEIFDVDVDAARLTDPPPAQPQQDCHRGVAR
jgi:hypothetical protein